MNSEAMSFLASLPREKLVKVVCVCGQAKTGKSFLLNLIHGKNEGFEINKSVE